MLRAAEKRLEFLCLVRLISIGALVGVQVGFWLVPNRSELIKIVARTILQIVLGGIQVFVAAIACFAARVALAASSTRV